MAEKIFKMTKVINAEELYQKMAALGEIYFRISSDIEFTPRLGVTSGIDQLYNEALVDLELYLFEARYTDLYDHVFKDVKMVKESKETAV